MKLLSVLFFLFALKAGAVEVVAHRGGAYLAPENTLASMKKGWETGVLSGEIDVFKTRDGRIVVIHDETTKRTSGVDLKVEESSSEELRKLDVGSFKGEEFKGEKIPFLEEVLEIIPPGRFLFIEFKSDLEILPPVKEILLKSGKLSQVKLISFDFPTICRAKEMMPEVPAYWLVESEKDPQTGEYFPYDDGIIEKVISRNLDGVDLYYKGLNETFIKNAHSKGLKVYVWTVNKADEAYQMKKIGVDGVTTDRPDFIKQVLELR